MSERLPFNPHISVETKFNQELLIVLQPLIAERIAKIITKHEKAVRKSVKKLLAADIHPGTILDITQQTLKKRKRKQGKHFVRNNDSSGDSSE